MSRAVKWAWLILGLLALVAVVAWPQEPYDEGAEMLLLGVPVADGGLGTVAASGSDAVLMETGDYVLMESGDKILLEN